MTDEYHSIIKVIIVDDDENSLDLLDILVKSNFKHLKIIGKAKSVKEAIRKINKLKPNLLLLDISLPDGTGFDILEKTTYKGYEVIFTTSFNQYAVRAFEFSALHYLLKPINKNKLKTALERLHNYNTFEGLDYKLSIMRNSLYDTPKKILLSDSDGVHVYNISDIMRCEASGNYTNVHLINGNVIVISKNLQYFDEILSEYNFVRVHNSHLINLNYLKKYIKGKYAWAVMKDKSEIPISESSKSKFNKKLNQIAEKF